MWHALSACVCIDGDNARSIAAAMVGDWLHLMLLPLCSCMCHALSACVLRIDGDKARSIAAASVGDWLQLIAGCICCERDVLSTV
jgi:hypothetical protein